jgi:hypothetical protein
VVGHSCVKNYSVIGRSFLPAQSCKTQLQVLQDLIQLGDSVRSITHASNL